jgi:quinoprotein glucose dehydrogenase
LKKLKTAIYQPGNKTGVLLLPGYDGGAEWGGAAADPEGTLYVNSNEMAWILKMVETPKKAQLSQMTTGERLYYSQCSACHGKDRMGNPKSNYPSLLGIEKKYDKAYINRIISTGKGMMPGFTAISANDKQAIVSFLLGEEKKK